VSMGEGSPGLARGGRVRAARVFISPKGAGSPIYSYLFWGALRASTAAQRSSVNPSPSFCAHQTPARTYVENVALGDSIFVEEFPEGKLPLLHASVPHPLDSLIRVLEHDFHLHSVTLVLCWFTACRLRRPPRCRA
jgi:hypothetical protein